MNAEIQIALAKFVVAAQEVVTKGYADMSASYTPKLSVEMGRRYARLVRDDGSSRSVHCFVDLTNGDVLKAASWKTPAKHARGNVLSADNGVGGLTAYGAKYL